MLYLTEPLSFISAVSSQNGNYTNYKVNVISNGGYTNAIDCTKDVYESLNNCGVSMGQELQFRVLSYVKKHQRKDGSGSFTMHHELATGFVTVTSWPFDSED